MHIDLSGRTAVITGGGRGIGRELVLRLAEEGVNTVALDVNEADLLATGSLLEEAGRPGIQIVVDITDEVSVQTAIAQTVEHYGRIDILLNNAGITATAPTDLLDAAAWRRCFDVNVTGTFLMSKHVIPVMKAQKSGRIINAASFAAIIPSVAHAAYGASKAAVVHFTRALAGELGPWNITANAYAPGMVPTQLNHFTERPEAEQVRLLDTLTLRRWGSAQDIGNLVCYLASDEGGYITGSLLDISGGKLATQVPGVAYEYAESGDPASIV